MILTGNAIIKAVQANEISFDPFVTDQVNPNSMNYRIGDELYVLNEGLLDPKQEKTFTQLVFGKNGYVLEPGKLYLGHTKEKIGSQMYVPKLIGRSSVGRLGLFLQVTADLGQLGAAHQWTLELRVVQPLRIYPGMKIGQVSFWTVMGDIEKTYIGGYTAHNLPAGHVAGRTIT